MSKYTQVAINGNFDVGNISCNREVILYNSSLKRPSVVDCTHTSPCCSQERVVFVVVCFFLSVLI